MMRRIAIGVAAAALAVGGSTVGTAAPHSTARIPG
jgi:hypothetical protein